MTKKQKLSGGNALRGTTGFIKCFVEFEGKT